MRACMPTLSTCQPDCVSVWFTCQRPCVPAWFTCQRVCVPTCQKRANFSVLRASVPINVPTCHKACQFFKHSSYEMLRGGGFYTLSSYKKFCIILDIIVIHICICIVHKNCVILHFYTSCHIKEKCVKFLLFESFLILVTNETTWFLYVTSNKGFLQFSTAKTTKQNKEYV